MDSSDAKAVCLGSSDTLTSLAPAETSDCEEVEAAAFKDPPTETLKMPKISKKGPSKKITFYFAFSTNA